MDKDLRARRWPVELFCAGLFLLLFLFFDAAHPLALLDLDDWAYFSYARTAIPSPSFWNPSRILPELLMPLCGSAAGLLNSLFFHDYAAAQVFAVAVTYSLFITAYLAAFLRLMEPVALLGVNAFSFSVRVFTALS